MKKWVWLLFVVLVLSVSAALAGNTMETAALINLNTDISDRLDDSGEGNYYRFTTPGDGYITVSLSHDYKDASQPICYLIVMDADENIYVDEEYAGNVEKTETSARHGLPAGTYYVKIDGYDFLGYTFRVSFTQSDAWETEFNDEIVTADVIGVNRKNYGTLWNSSDGDYYSFTLPAAGYVSVSFGHDYVDTDLQSWCLTLIDRERNAYLPDISYAGNEQAEKTSARCGLPAGTYLVEIVSIHWTDADYWFQVNYTESDVWETELNDSITDADPIELNKDYTGTITTYYDIDYYKLTVPEEGELSIIFGHEAVSGSGDRICWEARVIDPQQNEKATASFRGDKGGEVETPKFTLPAGTYYLVIDDGVLYPDIDYHFKVTFSVPKISISDAVVETIADHVYTGKAIKPAPKVTYQGQELVKGTDYKVSYSKNTDVGQATVTVKGIGRFAGSVKVKFRIIPKAIRLQSLTAAKKALTVKWSKGKDVTGYEIQYSLKKDFSSAKKITISKASTVKTTISKLNAKKTYYVRIRAFKKVGGKKYYSAWSNVLNKKTK